MEWPVTDAADAAFPASTRLDRLLYQDDVIATAGIIGCVALAVMNVRLDLAYLAVAAVYLSSFSPLSAILPTSQKPTVTLTSHIQKYTTSHTFSFSKTAASVSSIRPLAPHPSSCLCDLADLTHHSSSVDCSSELNGVASATVLAHSKVLPGHELCCGHPTCSTYVHQTTHAPMNSPYLILGPPTHPKPPRLHIPSLSPPCPISSRPDNHAPACHPRTRDWTEYAVESGRNQGKS
jgi:hypothetical protein